MKALRGLMRDRRGLINRKVVIIGVIVIALVIALRLFLSFIHVPPILMYHSVDIFSEITKLSVSPELFAKQMDFFYRHKYNVVSLEEMVNLIKSRKGIPPKTVTITFDDGYTNNYDFAYPVLKKYGFPATFFIITTLVGKPAYMDWDQLKELEKNNITIGSHTIDHQWLPNLSDKDLRRELFDSKKVLEKHLNNEVKFVSYPVGAHDERVQKVVKEAGYEAACATNPGPDKRWDDIYALKRLRISRSSTNMVIFWIETSGYYTFIKEVRDEK